MRAFLATYMLFWLLLTGNCNAGNIVYGFIALGITSGICKLLSITLHNPFSLKRVIYAGWLAKEVVIAALGVTKMCFSKSLPINSVPQWIKSNCNSQLQVVYAYSITITPGTVAIMIDEHKLLVHAIHPQGIEDIETLRLEQKIQQLMN